MTWARRLFSAILTLALAQFGAVAIAPAHAHDAGGSHGVREIVLAHGHAHADAGAGGGHHDDDHHPDPAPAQDTSSPIEHERGETGGVEHAAHVHGCPQFAPAEMSGAVVHAAVALSIGAWPLGDPHLASRSTAPPLRPPRAFL